jgi:hypothetical protein
VTFKCVAKLYGDSVEFGVEAGNVKDAYQNAKTEARNIFSWKAGTQDPSVVVKPVADEGDED